MSRAALSLACLIVACAGLAGCRGSPIAPMPQVASPAAPALGYTLSGHVSADLILGEPPLDGVLLEVWMEPDHLPLSAISDVAGYYRISALRGSIVVRASKDGYGPRLQEFVLAGDMVLNFGLMPIGEWQETIMAR